MTPPCAGHLVRTTRASPIRKAQTERADAERFKDRRIVRGASDSSANFPDRMDFPQRTDPAAVFAADFRIGAAPVGAIVKRLARHRDLHGSLPIKVLRLLGDVVAERVRE